jgi:hypothetical protein
MTDTTDATNEAAAQTLAQRAWFRLEGVIERLQDFVAQMNTPRPVEPGTRIARERSIGTDNSVHGSDSAHVSTQSLVITDKGVSLLALALAVAVMVIALVALERTGSSRDLAEARYADLVARNAATEQMAKLAERNATVAVERSHDLMARTGRLEAKAGIYSTDH